jgi:Domain of unknown function (DUF4145)
MAAKNTPASITETAFDCPHCCAFTTQHWFKLSGEHISGEQRIPFIPNEETKEHLRQNKELIQEIKGIRIEWVNKIQRGLVFMEPDKGKTNYRNDVDNLSLSQCYSCNKFSVWVHKSLVFPPQRTGPAPNQDLPEDIINDFEEARSILNFSPRGAAALLRLAVQKLCIFLGEKGKNIDTDIESLVGKGLDPLVQKSLDVVRVIGNEAVHPGVIDLKDDRETAVLLLDLVNFISERMISHPKSIQAMYDQLPEGKKQGIDARNKRALRTDKK